MNQTKLKELIRTLKDLLGELESEVYSDPSKYLQSDDWKVRIGDDNDGEPD